MADGHIECTHYRQIMQSFTNGLRMDTLSKRAKWNLTHASPEAVTEDSFMMSAGEGAD